MKEEVSFIGEPNLNVMENFVTANTFPLRLKVKSQPPKPMTEPQFDFSASMLVQIFLVQLTGFGDNQ